LFSWGITCPSPQIFLYYNKLAAGLQRVFDDKEWEFDIGERCAPKADRQGQPGEDKRKLAGPGLQAFF